MAFKLFKLKSLDILENILKRDIRIARSNVHTYIKTHTHTHIQEGSYWCGYLTYTKKIKK